MGKTTDLTQPEAVLPIVELYELQLAALYGLKVLGGIKPKPQPKPAFEISRATKRFPGCIK